MALIHPTAVIDPAAELAADVQVGPYVVIGPHVRVDAGTTIGPHCVIEGHTSIGRENRIFQFCSLGAAPQDKKYAGEPTRLEIGDRNTIREFCTFNRGTVQDAGVTRVGHDNWLMAYVHLAHDCRVGDRTIFANNAQLAGHCQVGDWAILGGFTVVHQYVRIGAHAMTAMGTILFQDLPPFVTASGNTARAHGINVEGLRRRGFAAERLQGIKRMHKALYRAGLTLDTARAQIETIGQDQPLLREDAALLLDFLRDTPRGIVR